MSQTQERSPGRSRSGRPPWRARRVVVVSDGSAESGRAVAWAAEEAARHRATMVVGAAADSGEARALADACAPDELLVFGRSADRHPLHRSLVHTALRAARCPVVVTPPVSMPPRHRVLVGVDCSPAARAALAVAAVEADLRGDALHALNVVRWDSPAIGLIRPGTAQLVAWGRHLVDSELYLAGVAARPVVIPGRTADVLVRHSVHADLLVVGSHAHGPFLGRTVADCADHAACPVLVVKAGPAPADGP